MFAAGAHQLSYFDNNFPGRAGWKEIVVLGDVLGGRSTIVGSSAPDVDRSQELTNYSTDLLNSPPQQLAAVVNFRTAGSLTRGPESSGRKERSRKALDPSRLWGPP